MYKIPESERLNHSVRNQFRSITGILTPGELVQKIFSYEDSIYEKELQALAFISELQWLSERDSEEAEHLSKAQYYRTPRGVYSEEIRNAIEQFDDIYSRVAYSNGYRTKKWDTSNISAPHDKNTSDSNTNKERSFDTIEAILQTTQDMSGDYLMRFCLEVDDVRGLDTGDKIDLDYVSDYW